MTESFAFPLVLPALFVPRKLNYAERSASRPGGFRAIHSQHCQALGCAGMRAQRLALALLHGSGP
jgi:hypothetical protein